MEKSPTFQVQPFGGYYLLERLAVGGMAEIFKAKQTGVRGFEKIVALKKILGHLSSDPEFVEMFEDEAKIAAQLHQSNIVQIYELGEVDHTLYITMEFVEGKNLRDITKAIAGRGLHLSMEQSVFIMMEVLKGLNYAHRKKDSASNDLEIIHRDMSPQNIIVSYEGEVKILDFGIAKAASKVSRTEAGVLKGKFSYMSPEQASGKIVTQHTDIYACGVILHELLTSKRLFRCQSDMETLDRVKEGLVLPPSESTPGIPPELDRIVLKSLAKEIPERYQSAHDFLSDLTRFSNHNQLIYSSQDLAIFMRTAFKESIEQEKSRLQRALEMVPQRPKSQVQNAKTHIAFKYEPTNGRSEKVAPSETPSHLRETTISTHPSKRKKIRPLVALLSGLIIIVVLALFVKEKPSESESAASKEAPEESIDLPKIPDQEVQKRKKPRNIFQGIEAPLEEEPVEEPIEETPARIEKKAAPKPKPPVQKSAPKAEPKQQKVPKPKVKVAKPKKTPQTAKPKAPPTTGFGLIDMVAPPEGYAQLVIDNKKIGSVPGPKARGIKLSSGVHFVRCEASGGRTYSGTIKLKKDERLTVHCDKLR